MNDQLSDHFWQSSTNYYAPFIRNTAVNHNDLNDECKMAWDKRIITGVFFMDLSKAFDCLPHGLTEASAAIVLTSSSFTVQER